MHYNIKKTCNYCGEKNIIDLIISEKIYVGGELNFDNSFDEKNVKYLKCVFEGIVFADCMLDTAIFQNCVFKNSTFKSAYNIRHSFVEFNSCNITNCNFITCSFPTLIIKNSTLEDVVFNNTNMRGANLIGNRYSHVDFIDDCNLMDAIIIGTKNLMDISFINEKSYTKLNYGTYIGRFKGESDMKNYTNEQSLKTSYSYMDFADQYLRNHVGGKYGICFYESKVAFHKTLKGKNKIKSSFSKFICGYGEKPLRTFYISILIIIIFSMLYMMTGIKTSRGIVGISSIKENLNPIFIIEAIIYSLYFSVVTFSTVGYGDITPCGMIGVALSITEIVLGILLMGVWTATLVRKMTR